MVYCPWVFYIAPFAFHSPGIIRPTESPFNPQKEFVKIIQLILSQILLSCSQPEYPKLQFRETEWTITDVHKIDLE